MQAAREFSSLYDDKVKRHREDLETCLQIFEYVIFTNKHEQVADFFVKNRADCGARRQWRLFSADRSGAETVCSVLRVPTARKNAAFII